MKRNRKLQIDWASIAGLAVAAAGILGGLILEGGRLQDVQQFTAALIVLGGTLGAVLITTPASILRRAAAALPVIFTAPADTRRDTLELIIRLAAKARRTGIVSLEPDVDKVADPFLQKAFGLLVDGTDPQELRAMMDLDIAREDHEGDSIARVYEAAGGYAPTIGIIGAVLGLIQVMKHLSNIDEVGRGIAVAFVATVYGVGVANLFFIPAAGKLRALFAQEIRTREMTLEGIIGITEGLNPRLIRLKMEAFLPSPQVVRSGRRAGAANAAAAGQKVPA